jgi:hypothetical protein
MLKKMLKKMLIETNPIIVTLLIIFYLYCIGFVFDGFYQFKTNKPIDELKGYKLDSHINDYKDMVKLEKNIFVSNKHRSENPNSYIYAFAPDYVVLEIYLIFDFDRKKDRDKAEKKLNSYFKEKYGNDTNLISGIDTYTFNDGEKTLEISIFTHEERYKIILKIRDNDNEDNGLLEMYNEDKMKKSKNTVDNTIEILKLL